MNVYFFLDNIYLSYYLISDCNELPVRALYGVLYTLFRCFEKQILWNVNSLQLVHWLMLKPLFTSRISIVC